MNLFAVSLFIQTSTAYQGALFGYFLDYDQRYYLQSDNDNYEWPKRQIRRLRPRRNRIHRIRDTYEDNTSEDDCRCSCEKCKIPKLCCAEICAACTLRTDVVYVPYPVPLIVTMNSNQAMSPSSEYTTTSTAAPTVHPTSEPPTSTTTIHSTTPPVKQQTTPTGTVEEVVPFQTVPDTETHYERLVTYRSTQPPKDSDKRWSCPPNWKCDYLHNQHYHRNKYQGLLADRQAYKRERLSDAFDRPLRQTSRNWLPKYGIVSIPDHLARIFVSDTR